MLLDDVPPEGAVYVKLRENSVPNVPHCSLAVDVGNEKYHKSQTDRFAGKYSCNPSVGRFTSHRHYRLVLDTTGERLEEFRSSQALVKGIYASLQGRLAKCW